MLTLETLREHIPAVQSSDPKARERAQEALLEAAAGLLWKWAVDEQRRLHGQLGMVSTEDVYSILVGNFIEALDHVELEKLRTSATNYLYHRVVSRGRRELHQTHGHLHFSHEFLEGARRARAIQLRLRDELGREPTDEEIIDASKFATPGIHMGAVDRDRSGFRKPFTVGFIKTWRENAVLLEMGEFPTEDSMYGYGQVNLDAESDNGDAIRALFDKTAELAGIPESHLQVLYYVHGVNSEDGPLDIEEAAELAGITRQKASRVVTAWVNMCRTPGSAFHRVLSGLTSSELAETGMADILADLGECADGPVKVPSSLVSSEKRNRA